MSFGTFVVLLPDLIALALRFMSLLIGKGQGDAAAYLASINEAITGAAKAKTGEEHQDAAKRLALAIAGKAP